MDNKKTMTIAGIILLAVLVGGGLIMANRSQNEDEEADDSTVTVTPTSTPSSSVTAVTDTTPTAATTATPTTSSSASPTATTKEFTVEGSNYSFSLKNITVNQGDTVKITFKNKEGIHDWVLDEFSAKTKELTAGSQETVSFVANKKGSFEYYCSVGTHRQMGMKGTLTVK